MNIKSNILYGVVLLVLSGLFLPSCQQDLLDDAIYSKEELIAQGRYLTARSFDTYAQDADAEPRPFEVGTPYRLLAFSKPYSAANASQESPLATFPRFNKVAWEGETAGGIRFLNIDSDPSQWFGFSALSDESAGDDGLVSLDFYGFTYGKATDHTVSYIPLEGWQGKNTDLAKLTHTESVTGGVLNDLMRGELLNQNIATAGITGTDSEGNQLSTLYTQSVIPFHHCFSKLHFQVSQQAKENVTDADGNPVPAFENLVVEKIEVTDTYETGVVSLSDGKIAVSGKIDRTLPFDEDFSRNVTLTARDAGEMVLFPSDGAALSNLADGYTIGLRLTVKSTVRDDIQNMLTNTGSTGGITEETDANNVTWYKGTIVKNEIIDYYTDANAADRTLYLRQNTSYLLIILFQKDSVRIITVRPLIEEWLPGEGTADKPWQTQHMGQPQMFDNIVWSDRNIGADHYDPIGSEYEMCVGYFYQDGRNIPYYPFQYGNYSSTVKPDLRDIRLQNLANASSSYNISKFRFYPVVDTKILKMTGNTSWTMNKNQTPQMSIPEVQPTNAFFDFMGGGHNGVGGLTDEQNMHWDLSQANQPVSGVWHVPSSQEFLTIFPSTPHAGNITFRVGGDNSNPMNWAPGAMSEAQTLLRVTVPYYYKDMPAPQKANASLMYTKAWNTLASNKDDGCTSEGYYVGPGGWNNTNYEPDGDPEDGFASVYIISRRPGDKVTPDILKGKDSAGQDWVIKSWGTIYAIKRVYTPQAYRMRWRVINSTMNAVNPCFYVEICRYRCRPTDTLTESNFSTYDWSHPAATIYFPICGLGDWTGQYINFGTEVQYATSDKIVGGKTGAVQIKVSGNDGYNAYISVIKNVMNRNFGVQIRPVAKGIQDRY